MGYSSIFLTFVILASLHDGGRALFSCPTSFERKGRQCYTVVDLEVSWMDAKGYCAILGGDLARINSTRDQSIIDGQKGIDSKGIYWLDGSDMLSKKEWRWMGRNGASIPFTYTNWQPGEPNKDDEHCLEIRYRYEGKWNNIDCNALRRFICQARAVGNRKDNALYLTQPPKQKQLDF